MPDRKDKATTPAPITAPVVHYEGSLTRRALWALVAVEALGIIINAL